MLEPIPAAGYTVNFHERVNMNGLSSSELVSSLSSCSSGVSAQSLSVKAWFRCVLQQHLHRNLDGTDSRTGENIFNTSQKRIR